MLPFLTVSYFSPTGSGYSLTSVASDVLDEEVLLKRSEAVSDVGASFAGSYAAML